MAFAGIACMVSGALPALARQITATIRVVHDDPDGIIEPGQSVQMRVVATWQPQVQFAGARFDTIATQNLGQASNFSTQLGTWSMFTLLGQPNGGSIMGTDLAVIPNFFTSSPQFGSFSNGGLGLIQYTWTAPSPTTPTPVSFTLETDPLVPDARFYPLLNSPAWVFGETTWIGTSVVVLPSPAGLAAVALAAGLAGHRRRSRPAW